MQELEQGWGMIIYRGNSFSQKKLFKRHTNELAINQEIKGFRIMISVFVSEKGVDNGGEAESGEVGGDGDGGGRNFIGFIQLRHQTHLDPPGANFTTVFGHHSCSSRDGDAAAGGRS